MKIYIPTFRRVDQQITFNSLPDKYKEKVVMVVQRQERDLYDYDCEYMVVDDNIGLTLTRTHIFANNRNKRLTTLNTATKTNLSTYLEQFRMLTDAINIKDAFIINFQIEFEITTFKNYNNQTVLLQCISELKSY